MSEQQPYNSLRSIFGLRDLLAELDPEAPPTARVVRDVEIGRTERIGVLAGSFNPLTTAHTGLIAAAKRAVHLPSCYFLLSKVTVDKELISGALLEDRLNLLERYSATHRGLGVLVVNRGLYLEQAIALHRSIPALQSLYFIVGFDKILQIFDPRYYSDRNAALRELFALASFLVAPRAGFAQAEQEHLDLGTLLSRPENREFSARVIALPLPKRLATLSSTLVREQAKDGQTPVGTVPPEVLALIAETGAYQSPVRLATGEPVDRYSVRARLVDLLDKDRTRSAWHEKLPQLLGAAWSETPSGCELRRLLSRHDEGMAEYLHRYLASLTKARPHCYHSLWKE